MNRKGLCGIILTISMLLLVLSGCSSSSSVGSSNSAGISNTKWYMSVAGSQYELDFNSDGTAIMYRTDYKGDTKQSNGLSWKSKGDNVYELVTNKNTFDFHIYNVNESYLTSTQILELWDGEEYTYYLQNSEDAQKLFNHFGGAKPDFVK